MFCPKCEMKWANFDKKDWQFVGPEYTEQHPNPEGKVNGFYPRHKKAEENRKREFDSEEVKTCPDCRTCAPYYPFIS